MEKEQVIIDVFETEDGYEYFRVYLAHKPIGEHIPPSNTSNGGFFLYNIDEDYIEEWDVVEDFRTQE